MSKIERQNPGIFLCYSKKDIGLVRQLHDDLRELRVDAWLDERELKPGDSLHDSIGRALERSAYVGAVVSPDSVKSFWVRKELNQALCQEGRSGRNVVIPLRIRDATMPPFLEDKLYLDFGLDYHSALTQLAAHVNALDRQRVMEELAKGAPKTLTDVKEVLRIASWQDAIVLGPRRWASLTEVLRRYGIDISGDRLSIIEPVKSRGLLEPIRYKRVDMK
jgi:hypothetical protein